MKLSAEVNIGIGLPTTVPGATGDLVLEWARRADAGPFSSVGVLERVVYDSYDPFAALAAAAAATSRVRLATMIAIGPLRSTALLAKQAASVHALSGGRLTLGLAVGARTEDFDAAGVEHKGRGKRLGEQLAYIRGNVDGDSVGPSRDGIEILVGGLSGQAYSRMARYADGYAHNGGPPRAFANAAGRALAAWSDLGRPGQPKLWGQGYFAFGDPDRGSDYLLDYYAFTGPVRREDRRREPDERPGGQGLRPRLRGGRLRRARPLPDRGRDRRARAAPGGARVNVEIVGAGPAGLYLAILLRKLDRGVDVRVLERNPPDATFGFGVVFSEETLGALRDADPETHLEITDTFARWDRIDIRFQGRELSSRGHSFSAIARKRLLEILQERCRELGVTLEFGVEVEELPDADLVVGADGANSLLRRFGDFGTKVRPEGSKYVWFGTDHVFDAFTFAFRETEHGLFNAHAYPYDERMSTFIVECPEPVWRAAGLDEHGRAGEPRLLRAAVRERAARAGALLEPLALARLPEDHERDLARGEPRHPRRRGAHGALLDRVGDEARAGGLDLARGRVGAPALGSGRRVRRLRAGARAVRRSARRTRPARVPRTSGGSRATRTSSRSSSRSTC